MNADPQRTIFLKPLRNWGIALLFTIFNTVVTRIPIYFIRHWYLRTILRASIGRETAVHMGCFVTGWHLTVGRNTAINRSCYLDGRVGIVIGDNVNISPQVYILSLTHDLQDPEFHTVGKEVRMENHVWIGARAIIMPGVTLGEGCVVGAGAVVTKDVAPFTIVAGVPAKKIGERNREIRYTTRYFPLFDTDVQL